MATYKEISRNNWKVTITVSNDNGKRKRVSKQGFKSKAEAKKYANRIENEISMNYDLTETENIYMKDFIYEWYYDHKSLEIAITTKGSYLGRIKNYIVPLLGDYKLSEMNNRISQNFYNKLIREYNLKPATAKKVFEILSSCLKYAKKQNLINTVCTDITKLKSKKEDILCWDQSETNFFLSEIEDDYLYTPVLITILTGLRIGELCGLRWEDIDFKKRILNVRNQVIQDKLNNTLIFTDKLKTPTSYRKITLPKVLLEHLLYIKKMTAPSDKDFIIVNSDDEMCNPRNISVRFSKKVAKYPQLKQITFHGLRHTHATILIEEKENIKVVSERLGHKDVSITLDIYTHTSEKMHYETAHTLDCLFG